jgi:hypothetical protein
MELRTHAREKRVCADALGGLLGQVGYLQAVLLGAWRIAQEELQKWKVGARKVEQLQGGG